MGQKDTFQHESLQDGETIQSILKAITKGFSEGKLELSDDEGEMVLKPEGLMNLKVSASQDDSRHRVTVRVTWQPKGKIKAVKPLTVNASSKTDGNGSAK